MVLVFHFRLGQCGNTRGAPIYRLLLPIEDTGCHEFPEFTDLLRFVGGIKGTIRTLPVA